MTRNIPNEQQKGGEELFKRGILEMDLIEGKGRDLHDNFGALDDWYWLSVVDVLTGYGLVATIHKKGKDGRQEPPRDPRPDGVQA